MPSATFHNLPPEKQERVLQAAIKEFGLRNVQEANLSNIVKEAGIARGSIYQYFTSKEDLYVYVFDTLRAHRAEHVQPAFQLYKKAPFLTFFEAFYLRDSEYLIQHPAHIALGQQLYSNALGVSRGLIQRLQNHYKEIFLIGIDFDKERGEISQDIDTSSLADLCVHFVTDIFIFQSVYSQLSMRNIHDHCHKTLHIIANGILSR
ncbi:MAG: TetR/AcrR family transcriptional regulator [Oscillospiraceae bacterium]|jgi:AcrR family transcriptional regulator|nr:TetR/AcrR family transcriptional regulator [Oscillospiraceae bacterium]